MKEKIKKIIEQFLKETESQRTELSEEHDIPSIYEPTFQDFINWLYN